MRGFQAFELVEEFVELGVGDFRIGVDVVALFVMANRLAKLLDALFGRRAGLGHRSLEST